MRTYKRDSTCVFANIYKDDIFFCVHISVFSFIFNYYFKINLPLIIFYKTSSIVNRYFKNFFCVHILFF